MIRWTAIVHYRTDAGIVDVTHDLSEIAELHDRVVDRRKGRSAMTRLLSLFGLMRVSEHERLTDERDNDAYASWHTDG